MTKFHQMVKTIFDELVMLMNQIGMVLSGSYTKNTERGKFVWYLCTFWMNQELFLLSLTPPPFFFFFYSFVYLFIYRREQLFLYRTYIAGSWIINYINLIFLCPTEDTEQKLYLISKVSYSFCWLILWWFSVVKIFFAVMITPRGMKRSRPAPTSRGRVWQYLMGNLTLPQSRPAPTSRGRVWQYLMGNLTLPQDVGEFTTWSRIWFGV